MSSPPRANTRSLPSVIVSSSESFVPGIPPSCANATADTSSSIAAIATSDRMVPLPRIFRPSMVWSSPLEGRRGGAVPLRGGLFRGRQGVLFGGAPGELSRDHARDSVAAHTHAVERVGGVHGALLVPHDDELRAVGVALHELEEAIDVDVVER